MHSRRCLRGMYWYVVSAVQRATNDADTTNHMADEDRRDLAKIFIQTNALPILNLEGENSDPVEKVRNQYNSTQLSWEKHETRSWNMHSLTGCLKCQPLVFSWSWRQLEILIFVQSAHFEFKFQFVATSKMVQTFFDMYSHFKDWHFAFARFPSRGGGASLTNISYHLPHNFALTFASAERSL